ncbi:P-type cation-transporting ATPase [Cladochytrium replicatum]|nr:P-type cation-transporting ATPase [Cladochytrium replicatum]
MADESHDKDQKQPLVSEQDAQPGVQFSLPAESSNVTVTSAGPSDVPAAVSSGNQAVATAAANAKAQAQKLDIDEHLMTMEAVAERYGTTVNFTNPRQSRGLTSTEAAEKLKTLGPNVLTPPKKVPPFLKWLHCLMQVFNILLIISAILTWALIALDPVANFSNSYIGAILFAVALLNATIEFVQLQKSAAILDSFLKMIPAKCTVIRDGSIANAPAADLVVGDIVFVRMGDKVPADIRIIWASEMKVDNSSLTGESEPQERSPKNTHNNPLEATNICFNSSLVNAGEGYGIVIRTADSTVIGQIASLTSNEKKRTSPLDEEINRFVRIISTLAITSAVVFFIIALFRTNYNINFSFSFAVGVLVAWVPQGLPATVTLLLSIAAKRMADRNVLVKDLRGVETLGAITLLATDKTGTLTRNQMTVTYQWASTRMYDASGSGIAETDVSPWDINVSGSSEMVFISALCTRAQYDRVDVPVEERMVLGDATEAGLFRFAAKVLPEIEKVLEKYPKVFEIPFNSTNKWHMTIHQKQHTKGSLTLYIKGAPERLLRICSTILVDGEAIALTDAHRAQFEHAYESMAGKGHRVLAFAQLLLDGSEYPADFSFDKEAQNYPTNNFCFVGLTSLEDPPKHGVREAIGHCREAGVKVMMVTGDHALTAEAIGRKINLMISDTKNRIHKTTGRPLEEISEDEAPAIVVPGENIDSLTDADWDNIFSKDEIIFARTSPKHKLEIVKRAQKLGHIVGVTGDGVNDSPALKKADLGISTNLSASDVSKEAAAMILLDDNFASTVHGIKEGRLIFANLKKSIRYIVTHIIPEVVPYLLYVIVPIPIAINPLQIIAVDLGFELFVALSFAFEPAETSTLMKIPPRRPVNPDTIERLRQRRSDEIAELREALPANVIADVEAEGLENEDARELDELRDMIPRSKKVAMSFRAPFTSKYWKNMFRAPEGEILVDSDALSWVYLEGAIVELVGALTAFFVVLYFGTTADGRQFKITPYDSVKLMQLTGAFTKSALGAPVYNGLTGDDQVEALAQAQSIFYFSVMIIQCFNLFVCKCRLTYPFGLHVFRNKYTFLTMFGGVAVAVLVVYCPPLNIVFSTSYRASPLFWLVSFGFGVLLLAYASLRMAIRRRWKPLVTVPTLPGLQMFPTRWSTGGRRSTKMLP